MYELQLVLWLTHSKKGIYIFFKTIRQQIKFEIFCWPVYKSLSCQFFVTKHFTYIFTDVAKCILPLQNSKKKRQIQTIELFWSQEVLDILATFVLYILYAIKNCDDRTCSSFLILINATFFVGMFLQINLSRCMYFFNENIPRDSYIYCFQFTLSSVP